MDSDSESDSLPRQRSMSIESLVNNDINELSLNQAMDQGRIATNRGDGNPTQGYFELQLGHTDLNGQYWKDTQEINLNGPRILRSQRPERSNELINDTVLYTDDIPQNYNQALKHRDKDGWIIAIQRELSSLDEMGTFKLMKKTNIPKEAQSNQTRWAFDRKPPPVLYKARLCFRGDLENINFTPEDVFSTVVRTENFRMIFCLILTLKWKFIMIDVSSAFLYAELEREVYIEIPRGHQFYEGKMKTHVFRLQRA